ncbi:MAG: GIY-YIG nuclease family protein [Candidatus Doudnabacteria bacterium]
MISMYYVYFLLSLKNNNLYVGSTENVKVRFKRHNSGKVKSTKAYCPWRLLGYKEFPTRSEAIEMEKFYKTHQQKDLLKIEYGLVAK